MKSVTGFDAAARSPAGGARLSSAGDLARAAVAVVSEWRRLSRSRRELSALDPYQLRDLGLSRSQAVFESDKSFLRK